MNRFNTYEVNVFLIIFFALTLFRLNAQTNIKTSSQSSAGRIINSTSFNMNFISGQSTPVGIIESGSYSLSQGFNSTIKNIFRTISLFHPNGNEILLAGSTKRIEWTTSNLNKVNLSFSINEGANWTVIVSDFAAAPGFYAWTVPNIESKKCLIRLVDATNDGIVDQSDDPFEIFKYPTSIAISLELNFGEFTKTESFRMIGIPGETNLPLAQILPGNFGNDWKAAYDNGSTNNFIVDYDGTDKFNFRPGNGFWIHSKSNISLSQEYTSVNLDENYNYSIPLHSGWNIISNPFNKLIDWNYVKTINSVSENIWDYQGAYNAAANLEPYKGYYFYNQSNLTVLEIPFVYGSTQTNKLNKIELDNLIKLELTHDNNIKSEINLGFSIDALNGYDKKDKYSPPGLFNNYNISIFNSALLSDYKYLNTDIREEIGNGQIYELLITMPKDSIVSINIDGIEKLSNYEIQLLDTRLNRFIDLKEDQSVNLKSSHTKNIFNLIIGNQAFTDSIKTSYLTKEYKLFSNYPNPFNPSTTIMYSIPKQSYVTLQIFDLLGKEVMTLVNKEHVQGIYEIEFSGNDLTSGVYFYRLQAGVYVETKKMILLK